MKLPSCMKLHYGAPPTDPTFHPREEGWTPLREPSPLMLNVVATPVGFALAALIFAGWNRLPAMGLLPTWIPQEATLLLSLAVPTAGLIALIAVHELIHGLTYPGFGTKVKVFLGIWPAKLLFYAATTDAVSRNRMLLVYVMPFVVLSLLPLLVVRLFDLHSTPLMLLAVVNALSAGGDATCVGLFLWQIPWSADVRNEGWATWWKLPGDGV